jgi:hypothetical protein
MKESHPMSEYQPSNGLSRFQFLLEVLIIIESTKDGLFPHGYDSQLFDSLLTEYVMSLSPTGRRHIIEPVEPVKSPPGTLLL